MSWNYEKVVADLRAEGFAPILLVSARTRPDLGPAAGEFRFHFPSAEDAEAQTDIYKMVRRALFEEHVREQVELELARRRRRHQDN